MHLVLFRTPPNPQMDAGTLSAASLVLYCHFATLVSEALHSLDPLSPPLQPPAQHARAQPPSTAQTQPPKAALANAQHPPPFAPARALSAEPSSPSAPSAAPLANALLPVNHFKFSVRIRVRDD
jgi:hypothetical protein